MSTMPDPRHLRTAPHAASDPRAARTARRAGAVLVFAALLSFALMGIAALVIDIGIARLTQSQMQTASDGMALEVLRERDLARDPQGVDDYKRDHRRRLRNGRIGSWHFTPVLYAGNEGDFEDTQGAGAFIDMQGGILDRMNASQTVQDAGFSVPRPRANYRANAGEPLPLNLKHGDLVSGSFDGHWDEDGDGEADGDIGYDGSPFHLEYETYERLDFEAAPAEQAPYGDSVLARLRRTVRPDDTGPVASLDRMPDVASSGETIPFFFGLGSTMHGGDPHGRYSPRHHGIGVRATSIAQARPAVRVGMPSGGFETPNLDDKNGIGAAPFVIYKAVWNRETDANWETDDGVNYYVTLLYVDGVLVPANTFDGQWAGYLQPPHVYRVGDRVYRMAAGNSDAFWSDWKNWVVAEAFVPIVQRKISTPFSDRVVGFGRVRSQLVTVEGIDGMRLWLLPNEYAPADPWIAPRNASALFDGEQVSAYELTFDTNFGNPVWTWDELIAQHIGRRDLATGEWLTTPVFNPVMAPALVR